MKKLLISLLFLPCIGWGAYQPVTGSTIVVQAANNNTTAIPVSQSGTFTVANSTIGVISASTLNVDPSHTTDSTLNASVSIKGSSNTVSASQSGTWTVQPGNTANTTPWLVNLNNSATDQIRVLVSSNTAFPTAVGDATNAPVMGDKFGRLVTMPIAPWGQVLVATATLTTTTAETVFISSTSAKINRLIGCIGENTSTTAADITIRPNGGPSQINTGSFKLGMSVSNVPVGFFPPMGIPAQAVNSNVTIQGSASVTSLHLTCWYTVE